MLERFIKYAFFLDIDGTLIWGDQTSERNINAIKRARHDGHLVFLNTGRALKFIPEWVLDTFELDGIVAGSGAYCSLHDRVVLAKAIPKQTLVKAFDFLAQRGRSFVFEGENMVLVHNRNIKGRDFYPICSSHELYTIYNDARIEKINISGVLDDLEMNFLNGMLFALQQSDYAECSIKGFDKAFGMKKIMSCLSPCYKSVAIGDSLNDIEMLREADISAAMGNSPESLKDLCDIVTVSAEKAGLADAFDIILNYANTLQHTSE